MKKEVLIAIIIGFSFGLIITFGIRTARRSLEEHQATTNASPVEDQTPTPTPISHALLLTNPTDGQVVTEPQITVAGTTSPNSLIAVLVDDEYQTTIADAQGNFSTPLDISAGPNLIQVSSFSPDNQTSNMNLTVIYSSALDTESEETSNES